MEKRSAYLIAIFLIIAAGVLVYANSLNNPLIWDDGGLIVDNLQIRHIGNIPRLFLQNVYSQDMVGRFYRPILMTTFALNYKLGGLNPYGYHLINLLLHLANAVLVYCLVVLICGNQGLLPFLTALLFAVHPIHTEAVTYISGRADPLAAFFGLTSLIFFIRYFNSKTHSKRFYYLGSFLSFILALLSKEASVIFPFSFILYEVCFSKTRFKPKSLYKYIPFFAALLSYGLVRSVILSNVKEAYLVTKFIPLTNRLFTIPLVILTYLRLLVSPFGLHMEHMEYMANPPGSLFEIRVLVPLVFLIVIGFLIWRSRKRFMLITFGSLWFFLNLLPVLNLVPINAFIAEHWLYIPSIGFFLVFSAVLTKFVGFKSVRPYIIIFLFGVFVLSGYLTFKQNYIWKDHLTFYKYMLKYVPQSSRLHTNLGNTYLTLEMYEEAACEYKEALRLNPTGVHAVYGYINLGVLNEKLGDEDEAIRMYEKVMELDPTFALAFIYIGKIHYRNNKYLDSIKFYRRAVELVPTNANYWNDLAGAYLKARKLKEAAQSYEKALDIYPYTLAARVNLGGVYSELGNPKRALEEYMLALRLAPDMPDIYYNIGNVCAQLGNLNLARQYWEKALEIDPNYADAREKLDRLQELSY
ncbi:MAG: hypothetical protein AMJ78_01670 [Omnitrophica WOR_2 bacterium SM23_29]|nr:MAG: hypothetical protein AMJ78_01670 [Omnitrophica WOR_2 bacterium SM23_29]